ncbi:putative serine esterase-domain-containing protein [Lentinula lateritia]|uniref:Serine esterase-domain-containing protein n=1 Tax=Lentinula aff. lateritia TaxID=2804960 RepID=A0ACC1TIF7_9AGAR|nr:putative serine esterase-domain-containing protein [Lentinula aff. lateritia]KAJ3846927.1 putative serine esterase-domain-containing protein [Lentinula lateritia]
MSTEPHESDADVQPIHLLVLVHGMWGHPGHLAEMARIVEETYAHEELHLLLAEANREEGTYDGIDWCAERVVDEIVDEINRIQQSQQLKRVTKFSITGYSLGGLVSRYVAGILAQRGYFVTDDNDNGPSSSPIRMTPMNFNTIATPHLGLIRYSTLFSSLAHRLGPKLLSRTGEQFYLRDNWAAARPLLDIMSDPSPSLPFYRSLTLFKQVRIFANAVNDLTVPYVTAAMEDEDPFVDWEERGVKVKFHPKYRPIITSYTVPSSSPSSPASISTSAQRSPSKRRPKLSKPLIPLPPFLVKPFPLNLLIYASLPLLVPLAFVLVFIRFTRATSRSRVRIRGLEDRFSGLDNQHHTNGVQSLVQMIQAIEHRVERVIEDAVVDTIDDPVGSGRISANPSGASTPLYDDRTTAYSPPSEPPKSSKNSPLLTPLQHTIAARLNTLPGLIKEIAFIDSFHPIPIRNAHAPIVSRDVRNFEHHKIGEGVLRCWVEGLVG